MKRPSESITDQQPQQPYAHDIKPLNDLSLKDLLASASQTDDSMQAIIKNIATIMLETIGLNDAKTKSHQARSDTTTPILTSATSQYDSDHNHSSDESDPVDSINTLLRIKKNQVANKDSKHKADDHPATIETPRWKKAKSNKLTQHHHQTIATQHTTQDKVDKYELLQCEKNQSGTIKFIASEGWLMPDPLINDLCDILTTLSIDEWLDIEQGAGAGTLITCFENLEFRCHLDQLSNALKTMDKAQCIQWETAAPGTLKRLLIATNDRYCSHVYKSALMQCLSKLNKSAIETIEKNTPHTLKIMTIFLASEYQDKNLLHVQTVCDDDLDVYHELVASTCEKHMIMLNQFDKKTFLKIENRAPFTLQTLYHSCIIADSARSALKEKLSPTEKESENIQQNQIKYLLKEDPFNHDQDECSRLISLMTISPQLLRLCITENVDFIGAMTPIEQCAIAHTLSRCTLNDWIIIEDKSNGTLKHIAEITKTKNFTLPKCLARIIQVKHPITAFAMALKDEPLTKIDEIISLIEAVTPGTKGAIRHAFDDIMHFEPEEQRTTNQVSVGEYIKRYQKTCHALNKYSLVLSRAIKFESPKKSSDTQGLFAAQKTITHAQKHAAVALVYSNRELIEETFSTHLETIEYTLIKQMQRILTDYLQNTEDRISLPDEYTVHIGNFSTIMQQSWEGLIHDMQDKHTVNSTRIQPIKN